MYFANISKLKNYPEKRFASFLLVLIFTLMAGFSPGLHNHEFDLDGPTISMGKNGLSIIFPSLSLTWII